MKKEHINIEDLFNQARNQPPVFTKEDARSLVDNRVDKGIGHEHSKFRFLKGVKPMNILIASLATAGAVSFFTWNPFGAIDRTDTGKKTINNGRHNVYASAQAEARQSVVQAPDTNNRSSIKELKTNRIQVNSGPYNAGLPGIASKTDPRNDGRIDIKGIKAVELDDKHLSDLGLRRSPEGLKLWLTGDSRPPVLCTLLVKGGLYMRENDNGDYKTFPVAKIMPRLITDNAGNKRLATFAGKDTYLGQYKHRTETGTGPDGKKIVSDENVSVIMTSDDINDSSRLNPGGPPPPPPGKLMQPRIDIHIEGMDSNWTNQFRQFNIQLDTLLKGRLKDVDKMLEKLNIDKSNIRKFIVPPMPTMGKPNKQVSELEKQARELDRQAIDIDKQSMSLDKQARELDRQAIQKEKEARKQINKQRLPDNKVESLRDKALGLHDKAADLRDKASGLRDKASDLRDKAMELRQESFVLPDTLNFDFDFDFPDSDSEKDLNMNDIINDVKVRINTNITPIISRIDALEDNMNNLVKINKLIPIEVKMGKNPEPDFYNNNEDFSFILWYEPTEEFLNVLPADVRQRIEPEVKALQTSSNICQSAPVAADEAYFDIWRSCSGAVENLAVFPNPASDYINVKYNLSQARNIEISLHDLSGRKIRSLANADICPAGPSDRKFEIADLQPGMYLISVQTDKNEQAVQRVIVER